jgi:hypothetical protein
MAKKIQVTLDDAHYRQLADIAERDGKKLAAVVRESIVRYCLGPEARKAKKDALAELFAVEAPVPEEYGEWKKEYSRLKTRSADGALGQAGEGDEDEPSKDERRG